MTFPYKDDEYKNNAYDYEKFSGLLPEEDLWTPWDDVEEEYDGLQNVWGRINRPRRD